MSFARLYVHFVWTTLDRCPHLTADRDDWLRECLYSIAERHRFALGRVGIAIDHVHVVARLPRDRSVAHIAQHLKGASAHEWNVQFLPSHRLHWQPGYWAETISPHAVPSVLDHVEHQRALHAGVMTEAWESLASPEHLEGEH
jgi:REP element-mobilizing transposase RayT